VEGRTEDVNILVETYTLLNILGGGMALKEEKF